jgi:hypothetical protein
MFQAATNACHVFSLFFPLSVVQSIFLPST